MRRSEQRTLKISGGGLWRIKESSPKLSRYSFFFSRIFAIIRDNRAGQFWTALEFVVFLSSRELRHSAPHRFHFAKPPSFRKYFRNSPVPNFGGGAMRFGTRANNFRFSRASMTNVTAGRAANSSANSRTTREKKLIKVDRFCGRLRSLRRIRSFCTGETLPRCRDTSVQRSLIRDVNPFARRGH